MNPSNNTFRPWNTLQQRAFNSSFSPNRFNNIPRLPSQENIATVFQNFPPLHPGNFPSQNLPNINYSNNSNSFNNRQCEVKDNKMNTHSLQTPYLSRLQFHPVHPPPIVNSNTLNSVSNSNFFRTPPPVISSIVQNPVVSSNCSNNPQYSSVPLPPFNVPPPNILFNNIQGVPPHNSNVRQPFIVSTNMENLQSSVHSMQYHPVSVPHSDRIAQNVVLKEETTHTDILSQKEQDLNSFINTICPVKNDVKKNNISLPEFRSSLKNGLSLLKMLQQSRDRLLHHISSDEEWEKEKKQAIGLQDKINEICNTLLLPENINAIKSKLSKISKKRTIKKKKKEECAREKLIIGEQIKILNNEIDKWLDNIKEKYQKSQREKEMQEEADSILSEVRRKIQEAKKMLEKIKVLERLRAARLATALQKGVVPSQPHTAAFEARVSELRGVVQLQLGDYEAEEKALRVMLETEHEGRLEEENLWRLRKAQAILRKRHAHIRAALFGTEGEPTSEDPLFLFHQYQHSANNSLDNLVQIRHLWDMHLLEDGEPVPVKWVVPVPPNNSSWEEVLEE